jgi:NAD(P)-dependent dehydrogenase (short-subunit alcohol dehydrogenase family)
MQLATNHLGHFLLTGLLLNKLRDTTDSRVVSVSSIAARQGRIDFDDLMGEKSYDTWRAYNQSKLANLLFGMELQRRLERSGARTTANIAHPGASTTNLFSTPGGGLVKRIFTPLTKRFLFQSAEAGAQPILFAATSPDAEPGGYYGPANLNEMKGPPAPARVPDAALDTAAAERLWAVSEVLVGLRYLPD